MALSNTPAPFLVSPSWTFDGDDGLWSTFTIGVGNPLQSFRVLPSTTSSETWIPVPQACQGILINVTDCNTLRGVNDNNGTVSPGFQTNESATWDQIGIYGLTSEVNLFGGTNAGLYGLDTVTLSSTTSSKGQNVSAQIVAGISTTDFWVGSVGLGPALGNFSTKDTNIPSLLVTMMNERLIPSLSFGYSAGASYGRHSSICKTSRSLTVSQPTLWTLAALSWAVMISLACKATTSPRHSAARTTRHSG